MQGERAQQDKPRINSRKTRKKAAVSVTSPARAAGPATGRAEAQGRPQGARPDGTEDGENGAAHATAARAQAPDPIHA